MTRSRPRPAALLVLAVAAIASVATSPGSPFGSVYDEVHGEWMLSRDRPTLTLHVRLRAAEGGVTGSRNGRGELRFSGQGFDVERDDETVCHVVIEMTYLGHALPRDPDQYVPECHPSITVPAFEPPCEGDECVAEHLFQARLRENGPEIVRFRWSMTARIEFESPRPPPGATMHLTVEEAT